MAAMVLYILCGVLVVVGDATVLEITLDQLNEPRFTPLWEVLPIVTGLLMAGLVSPNLASWEVLGRTRVRTRAGATAFTVAISSASLPWLASLFLPDDARWWDISCNVATFVSLGLIATAMFGRIVGGGVGMFLYLAVIVVQQMAPAAARSLPISGSIDNLAAHPMMAAACVGVATTVWSWTMGYSKLTRNLGRNN